MKLLRNEPTSTCFGKNLLIMGYEMWHVFDFSWKIVIIIQRRLKRYVIAAGVQMNEFVIARFAQR